jgi:hypothetical protein
MLRKRILAAALMLAAAGELGGCASTTLLSTWKDPSIATLSFHRVLVIAPSRDPALRRTAEDEVVRRIKQGQAVPSYTLFNDSELGDNALIRTRAQAGGFDGIVVMRILSVDKQATWVPGMWAGPYYAYGGWPAYSPGYMQVDTYVRVETNVYSLPDDRLVWAAASRTVNPGSARALVSDTAQAVAKAMRKQGLVP